MNDGDDTPGGWPALVAVLDAFLAGYLGVTETCRRVIEFRNPHSAEQSEVFRPFVDVEAETTTFPMGAVRHEWSAAALAREDEERERIEAEHRDELRAAALALRQYATRAGR
jgi:hypothetical protein